MQKESFFLEYAAQIKQFEQYPLPWDEIFHRQGPLAVEIGFGNGDFLLDWAKQSPGWNFIGIELSLESMVRIQKRLHRKSIANIQPVHEDARFAVREFFANNSLRHIIMNFPDPWPKRRHKYRRLLDKDFIDILAAILEKGGQYELVTDQEWYAKQAYALFQSSVYFTVLPIEQNPFRAVTTRYEEKWSDMGRNIYRVLATKIQTSTIKRLLEDASMPHAFIEKEINADSIKKLIGLEYSEANKLFVVKAGFGDVGSEGFILRIIAKDGDYRQGFYALINRHNDHRWLVKLDPTVQPHRTPAVKLAVYKIGEILNEG